MASTYAKVLSVTRFPSAMVGRSRTCRQRVHVERILTPRTHSSVPPVALQSPATTRSGMFWLSRTVRCPSTCLSSPRYCHSLGSTSGFVVQPPTATLGWTSLQAGSTVAGSSRDSLTFGSLALSPVQTTAASPQFTGTRSKKSIESMVSVCAKLSMPHSCL